MTIYAIEVIEEHTALIYVDADNEEEAEAAGVMLVRKGCEETELDTRYAHRVGWPDLDPGTEYWDNEAGRWEVWGQ